MLFGQFISGVTQKTIRPLVNASQKGAVCFTRKMYICVIFSDAISTDLLLRQSENFENQSISVCVCVRVCVCRVINIRRC